MIRKKHTKILTVTRWIMGGFYFLLFAYHYFLSFLLKFEADLEEMKPGGMNYLCNFKDG